MQCGFKMFTRSAAQQLFANLRLKRYILVLLFTHLHYHSVARAFEIVHINGCDSYDVPTSQRYCSVVESWSNMFQAEIRHDGCFW
jgi:hypothetical protein